MWNRCFSLFHYYYFLYFDSFLKRNSRLPFFFKTACLILSFEKLSFATFRKRAKYFTIGTSYYPILKLGFMLNPEVQRSIPSVLTGFHRAFRACTARGTCKRLYFHKLHSSNYCRFIYYALKTYLILSNPKILLSVNRAFLNKRGSLTFLDLNTISTDYPVRYLTVSFNFYMV